MRILVFVFALVFMTSTPVVVFAAAGDVSLMIISDLPVSAVIGFYEKLLGAKVTVSDELKALKVNISVKIEKKSKDEALKLLDDALAKQAGVEIVRETDGSYSARRLVAKK